MIKHFSNTCMKKEMQAIFKTQCVKVPSSMYSVVIIPCWWSSLLINVVIIYCFCASSTSTFIITAATDMQSCMICYNCSKYLSYFVRSWYLMLIKNNAHLHCTLALNAKKVFWFLCQKVLNTCMQDIFKHFVSKNARCF